MTQTADKLPPRQVLRQGYEPPGISNVGLVIFFILFVLMGVVIGVGAWFLLKIYLQQPRIVDVPNSIASQQQPFPAPNLQPTEAHNNMPWEDLAELRKEKQGIFRKLGWEIDAATQRPIIPQGIVDQLAKQRGSPSAAKGGQP